MEKDYMMVDGIIAQIDYFEKYPWMKKNYEFIDGHWTRKK